VDSQFRILGPIEVELPGGRIAGVPRGRARSLLALLLVHRGAIVHPDRVVDALWGEAGPRNARNAVQVVASRLRAAVGDGVVVSDAGGYAVRLWPGALDADRFEERFRRGREALARGDPRDAAETLRDALRLWRGPVLADVRDEAFAQPEIARLDDLRLACLSERVDADLALGRHGEVTGELETLVLEHPFRERLHGQLMLSLYRAGRQADALAAYRAARGTLVDGLGIEPSLALRELEAAILRQDVPAPAPPPRRLADRTDTRRRVTCVFSRLIHPGHEPEVLDPEALRGALERYHDLARAVCAWHGGGIAELRGDAVLAVFGNPVAHEDDAQRALRAAAELGARTGELPFGLCASAGVCTGDVVAQVGGPAVAPVIGQPVATAERLARSGACGEVRVAEATWRLVRHAAHGTALPGGGFLLHGLDDDAPAIPRSLDRPLVGRDGEVGRLRETFAKVAAERSPRLVTLLGEAGIGKSRLVAELAEVAGGRATVLFSRCPAYGEGITYWPLREIFLEAAGDRSPDELAAALGMPPSVAHRVAGSAGAAEGDTGEETGWAFQELLVALARVRPLVVAVDDVHWAEPALLDLLLDVAARLRDVPVLIVLAARPDPQRERPAWADRLEQGAVVRLGPLSATASRALLAAIAGGRLEREEERRIADTAGGNPLFLEQLVAYVGDRHSTDHLPPALHALLTARLDQLDTVERSVLALGAVVGDAFEAASVHALASDVAPAEVEQACDRLVGHELLTRPSATDGAAFRFVHVLVRDTAYATLAKSARARLHQRHASWLEELGSGVAEADARIGFHLETACRYAREVDGQAAPELVARAGRRLASAAHVAHGQGDLPGEIGFLERAVALLGHGREEGVELLPALVSALFEAGSFDRAEEAADLAVSASASLGLGRVHARAAVERERIRLARRPETFRVQDAVVVAEQAARTLRGFGDELGLARAAYLMSDLSWLRGDVVSSSAHGERMLTHARRAGSGFDAATALSYLGWDLVEGPCPVPEAIARCDALAREAAGQRAAELSLLGCRAALEAMTGGYAEARGSMARARVGLAELHLREMAAYLAHLDVFAELLAGDPVAAERAALDAEAIVSESGDRWFLSTVYPDLAHAILAQGRHEDAAEVVERIETVPAPCDRQWVIKRHTARALVASWRGDRDEGLREARAAVAAAEGTAMVVFLANAYRTLAEVLLAAGRDQEAATAAGRALALDQAKGNTVAAAATRRRFPASSPAGRPVPAPPPRRRGRG
jgi:DNA-binding SARP family transcriptional activator/tetratricopeptide (TPR) repeat protein